MWRRVVSICFGLFIFFNLNCFAATKEDVIVAIKTTYEIGEDTIKLPSSVVKKAENYLNKNPLTEEQYDNILKNIDGVVGIAKKNGTIDLNQMSMQDKMKALDLIADTSKNANIDLEKELEENDIVLEIPINNSQTKSNSNIDETRLNSDDINDKEVNDLDKNEDKKEVTNDEAEDTENDSIVIKASDFINKTRS